MTREEKDLLLKDLCGRLPYGVMCKVQDSEEPEKLLNISLEHTNPCMATKTWLMLYIGDVKPYLRPMSSMTEEEKEEMHNLLSPEGTAIYGCGGISMPMNHYGEFVPYEFMNRIIQYLLKKHFDFMGLISKGLAIAVTKENNPYK